ncbi:phospholipase D family protein [Allopusillimonas ginsengisoli]|uniref:phospholipase D family protein n=1 Tax=Allopusillimonas ginsengisoli TaxID=453575 RepID=UPI0010C17EB9|nr:phospholipase D family protein [Allopusillimonas ginsengisoli]
MIKPLAFFLMAISLAGCSLPVLDQGTNTNALPSALAEETRLGRAIAPQAAAHPGSSGIYPLSQALDAFAARMLLSATADQTLDVQYYIWRKDTTGILLLEALHAAADRGVRVRLLLDDNGITGLDNDLAALATHPNIQVRLFNPFVFRRFKPLGYLTDFKRLNRRMHNKSITADNQVTIIGGRNVGDEYFGASNGVLFSDLDVMAVGPIVNDVSNDFDRYWASESSYPIEQLVSAVSPSELDTLASAASVTEKSPAAMGYIKALKELPIIQQLLDRALLLEWAPTRMVSDDPAKALGEAPPEGLLTHQLAAIIGAPQHNLELISPYFVPTATGVEAFRSLAEKGVSIRILTNSLSATDVAVVHAGYAKRRKALLDAGITLYEMRSTPQQPRVSKGAGRFGSSGSSLHAKTFAVDDARIFVGSFNFDPRSANLNTELGFVIDSPTLAKRIDTAFNIQVPEHAYEVRLADDGKLVWLERNQNEIVRHETEPESGFWRRTSVWFFSLLPIEWML